jgi:hypothetical protein
LGKNDRARQGWIDQWPRAGEWVFARIAYRRNQACVNARKEYVAHQSIRDGRHDFEIAQQRDFATAFARAARRFGY